MANSIRYSPNKEPHWADITYGRLEKSPYVEKGLWFVHIPKLQSSTATYLVREEYAHPGFFERFGRNHEKWKSIAELTLLGSDWNAKEECRWRDMPYYTHILPDGTPIRFGLSRSQSKGYPERELWYVVIGLGEEEDVKWQSSEYPAFVVDKECTEPEFMNRMGSDPDRWRLICWEAPRGIKPWEATIDDNPVPDPLFVFKLDEEEKGRSWFQKLFG